MSKRTQIRQALVAALTGLATTGANAFGPEKLRLKDAELPALRAREGGEDYRDAAYLNGRPVLRTLRVFLEIIVKENAEQNDLANQILDEVETVLFPAVANRLGGLVHSITLASIEDPEMDDSTDKPAVRLPVILRVDYS